MTTITKTDSSEKLGVVLTLALGAVLVALVALAGTAREADAAYPGGNGRIVFQSERMTGKGVDNPTADLEIFTMKPDGTGLRQLTFNTARDANPSYSANGASIAFTSERDGNREIYVMNADGSAQMRITNSTEYEDNPSISPDGTRVAYDSSHGGTNREIMVWVAGFEVNLTNDPLRDTAPVFSPDGSKIAFTRDGNGGPGEIFVMGSDGTNPTNLTNSPTSDDYLPDWSPNGRKIAFTSYRRGNFDISVMKADGSEKKRLTTNETSESLPAWSPDGKRIAFLGYRDENAEIFRISVRTGDQQRLTNNPALDFCPDWQPLTN